MSKKAIVITHSPKPSKTLLAVIIIGLLWLGYSYANRTPDVTRTDDQEAAQQAAVEKADRLATLRAAAEKGSEQQAPEQQVAVVSNQDATAPVISSVVPQQATREPVQTDAKPANDEITAKLANEIKQQTPEQRAFMLRMLNVTNEQLPKELRRPSASESSSSQSDETACINLGNAYAQAVNLRDRNEPIKDTYEHVRAILQRFPQFNPKGIVNNVYFDPRFAYPAGGTPLIIQISQICMGTYKGNEPIR